MHPDGVMKVADTGSLYNGVIQVADTGIQVAYKQISIESGYNVFDEIAGTSVSYLDDTILFLDLSVSYFHLPPANCNVRTVMCHATWMTPLKEMNRLFKIVLNRGITFTSKISYYHFLIYVL
ncbi:hypothetical protein NMD99_06635 [Wolbachia endosymbiont of Listronotus oregonensis]|uniref:hypothetical protein n=1 Tax=Wolbachia endosymbiont of Listronotus oregonensis TaxID=2969106 RepID=UPI002814DA82|nr:hypothetical protein [Wolbachia endosymbiont of Listronotus oregonensis]WMT84279.1 hypothetical protein NMD99_06635 [Wolbachia endosymbiont of Listronotus oregonensis]